MDDMFDDYIDDGMGDFIGQDNLARQEQDDLNHTDDNDEVLKEILSEMSDEYDSDEINNEY
jgi:hypothetical protein